MGVIHKFTGQGGNFQWDGVTFEQYQRGAAINATKHVVVGPKDGAKNYSIRYFEVAPGGQTSFDNHKHDHGVVVLRGKGEVLLGSEVHEISFGDVIYISPYEEHQFVNTGDEPLGFLCVIPPKE
jgi:quercetin dioxygenase-like cupin family protein